MTNTKKYDPVTLFKMIKPGSRVTILVPNGIGRNGPEFKEATGKAVICNHLRDPDDLIVTLNMGGPHGTPGVATPSNLVRLSTKVVDHSGD